MSDDINPLAPAEDAEQEQAEVEEIAEAAAEEAAPADQPEVPLSVDQRHPQAHVGYAK